MPVTRSGGMQATSPSGDPKAILKEGRKALAAGQFDRAQDLAHAADRANPTGKWRLFDDTPRSLLEDIQDARAKQDKAQVEQLTRDAKALASRKAGSDAEKAANLDRAYAMAERAVQLHGPYSAWDIGDRADKLMGEIKAARAKLKVPPAASGAMPNTVSSAASGQYNSAFQPAGGVVNQSGGPSLWPAGGPPQYGSALQPGGGSPSGSNNVANAGGNQWNNPAPGQYGSAFQPSGGPASRTNTPANDARRGTAMQLMNEARALANQGQYSAARARLAEADRVGAVFAPNEYNPGLAIQELNAQGSRAINTLVAESGSQMTKKDYAKAEAALATASEIAAALGLYPRGVDEMRSQLRARSGGTGSTNVVAAGGPKPLFPGDPIDTNPVRAGSVKPAPVVPIEGGNTAIGSTKPIEGVKPAVPTRGHIDAQQLLAQARIEFRNNSLDMAITLASQAYNQGGPKEKDEATALLNSIDAEKYAQQQLSATRSFEAAQAAIKTRDYSHALGVLVLVDPKLLPENLRGKHAELIQECRTALNKVPSGGAASVATAGGMQDVPGTGAGTGDTTPGMIPGVTSPGAARPVADPKQASPDNLAAQQDALRRVQFQKMRSDGLKVQSDAQAAFGRGETDLAIQMLLDYANRVRTSGMEASSVAMLLRPIESRLEMFRVMKGQADALVRLNRENRDARERVANRGLADEQRRDEVNARVRKYHELVKAGEFKAAAKEAMVAKQLDPDNPALPALIHVATMNDRVREAERIKEERNEFFRTGLNRAETVGPMVDVDDPVAVRLEAYRRARGRGSLDDSHIKTRTPAEFEIELKLNKPIPFEVSQTPLDQVIDRLRDVTDLPISIDTAALAAEGINLAAPITERIHKPIATRHVLNLLLQKAGLSYVVENDVVQVTTAKKAKGRLFTKVFSVADLVTPIPNFALPDYQNMEKMLNATPLTTGRLQLPGGGNTPFMPAAGLAGGTATGTQLPGASLGRNDGVGIAGGLNLGPAGQLTSNPLGASSSLAGDRNTKHEQLIKLITGMVRPYSWDGMGGPGRIEYFDIGSALVVNQVADVIQEVADLLEALRRLQDLAVAVEIRIVSLSEAWYERLGVDFAMNIKTHNTRLEPALTQVDPNTGLSGIFAPIPFINDNNFRGSTVGITPAGNFTGDLGVPIRPNTFNRAIPVFGGYPNTPGDNGGIAFGLAFLNDIQVRLFMEAAQGDRRINVMQAPKITQFNGQTSTLSITDSEFFITNVAVVSVNGQLVFVPTNTPLPIGVSIAVQSVVSADRRFVRLNLPVTLTATQSTQVPLFPITTFITPVFEGGSQGVPIPFTQFVQQPAFTTLTINTTVVCPDGGTVLLGGLKTLQEGRNEFGPPFLSKIPYLNRLFKNVGIGRDSRHVMIMVTPRIIINSEEEIFQTETGRTYGGGPAAPGGQ
jgi:tetratricopeptide (TPR) repeat protein